MAALVFANGAMCLSASAQAVPGYSDQQFSAGMGAIQADLEGYSRTLLKPAKTERGKDSVYREVSADLRGSAVPQAFAHDAIYDPRTAVIPSIIGYFGRAPGKPMPYSKYRDMFISEKTVAMGAQFYLDHKALLTEVRARYNVDPLLLVSLVGIETRWGTYTGNYHVISALFTIADMIPRLSHWACRELAEYMKLCWKNQIGPRAILGSYAGAFGYYQFMPSSYNAYAVDFDGDGRKSWDQWPDVLASVAHYLLLFGYKPGPDESQGSPVWNSIYAYNHSTDYVEVVLEMRRDIRQKLGPDAPPEAVAPAVASAGRP